MGEDRAALGAVGDAAGVECRQPPEPVLVDDGAGAGGQRGQVGAVAGGHRSDVVQPGGGQVGEVRVRVLPGVEDDRHLGLRLAAGGADLGMPAGQRIDHGLELGDVGLVAWVGVPGQRDPAVAGDHQAQPGQPQVGALLLGLAALGDRRLLVAGIDEGGEVGHVQGHRRAVQPGCTHDPQRDRLADLLQLLQPDGVHRSPEPPVIQHAGADPGEPVARGGLPPVRERQLRAGGDHPVQGRQRQVGADAGPRIRAPRTGHLVDDAGDPQLLQHPPGRGDVPERQVAGALGQRRGLAGVQQRLDIGRAAQVPLRDQLRLAVRPAHLPQVPVRLAVDHLLVQTGHTLGHRIFARSNQGNAPDWCRPGPIWGGR